MIYRNGQLITTIHTIVNTSLVNIYKVYHGTKLIWRTVANAIKSCFGSGRWIADKPWLNNDYWKN